VAGGRRTGPNPLERALIDQIRDQGPLRWPVVVDRALYDPDHGFFATGGRAGAGTGDFLTSPEVGPLFGAVLARALDAWWDELGHPDPFTVIEVGAGTGTLARAVLGAEPRGAPSLRYVLVERSATLAAHHGDHLVIDEPTAAGPGPRTQPGPRVESWAELPPGPLTGVVVANELLDNLAFDLLELTPDGWQELAVGVAEPDVAEPDVVAPRLVEVRVPATPAAAELAGRLAPEAVVGARIPIQGQAAAWVADVLARLERGRLVVIDYIDSTASMARRPAAEWVRTYRDQHRGASILEDLGAQDVTCEVALDQLAQVRAPDRVESQASFLRSHGLGDLVDEGRRIWSERAHIGDLAAIRARSRVGEAEALTDPGGLGGFTVVQWRSEGS
jgi:SAM-dependent MidA family methyltransferase